MNLLTLTGIVVIMAAILVILIDKEGLECHKTVNVEDKKKPEMKGNDNVAVKIIE